eukprot:TRINITY_DN20127_c0_g1_i1.p1 TRINITY_DN20127_c0_g1~~TRINITY_DN20127_c0_g1_i1.p1  ORF type:complete len:700 (-),score=96.91 TRINITY_DN20127_c0_g1_i1:135-2234(-)
MSQEPLPFLPLICCSKKAELEKNTEKIHTGKQVCPQASDQYRSSSFSRAYIDEMKRLLDEHAAKVSSALLKFQRKHKAMLDRHEQVLESIDFRGGAGTANASFSNSPRGTRQRSFSSPRKDESCSVAGDSPSKQNMSTRSIESLLHSPSSALRKTAQGSSNKKGEERCVKVTSIGIERAEDQDDNQPEEEDDVDEEPACDNDQHVELPASARSMSPAGRAAKLARQRQQSRKQTMSGAAHRRPATVATKPKSADSITSRFVREGRCYDNDTILLVAPKLPLEVLQERVAEIVQELPIGDRAKSYLGRIHIPSYMAVKSPYFTNTVNVLIFANVGFIVVQAQLAVDHASSGQIPGVEVQIIDTMFSFLFLIELFVRIFAERVAFFVSDERRWNLLDIIFVCVDMTNALVSSNQLVGYWAGVRGAIRAIRLARAIRALRLLRALQAWRRCKLMVDEVTKSFSVLMVIGVILGVIMLFFAVVFMQATADSIISDEVSEEGREMMLARFNTIGMSVASLFQATSGGRAWGPEWDSMREVSDVYGMIFIGYIALSLLALFNVVTASFVESALLLAKKNEDDMKTHVSNELRFSLARELGFQEKQITSVTWEMMADFLRKPEITSQLIDLELDYSEVRDIFDLCDVTGTNTVNAAELSQACARFTRPVRCVDFLTILLTLRTILQECWATRAITEDLHRRYLNAP